MQKLLTIFYCILLLYFNACDSKNEKIENEKMLNDKAMQLSQKLLIIDTHIDVPYRLQDEWEDITQRTAKGHFDYPRAKQGGLDAAFISIYCPASYEKKGAKAFADKLINMVKQIAGKNPDKFRIAYSSNEVLSNFKTGIISFPLGMENGSPIEGDLKNLQYFYNRGIRYITLAHSINNHISDSSYDEERKWNGLSPFGKLVVQEMNRLGIMVDVSHLSDSAFYDVMNITEAPVIASHSSCRKFTPGWQRNMNDEMIKKLAEHNGVIMINFRRDFIDNDFRLRRAELSKKLSQLLKDKKINSDHPQASNIADEFYAKNNPGEVSISQVIDHIDHVVKLAGVDLVGFGSDFDGVRFTPTGLEDVSKYPNIILELLKRGYSEEDIQKICSTNILRVWAEVEETADRLQLKGD